MKICNVCVKSDMLCSGCTRRLERGELAQRDIDLARAINRLGVDAGYLKCIESNSRIVVVAEKLDTKRLIGKQGVIVKKLSVMFGKPVKVVERAEKKLMVEEVLNVPVIAINVVYAGSEHYKIRIESRLKSRVKDTSVLSEILGKNAEVVFE